MEFVLFVAVFIVLWLLFYCKVSLLPAARLRTIPGIRKMNRMTREYLLEIANCAVAAIAATLVASITVWYVTLFQ